MQRERAGACVTVLDAYVLLFTSRCGVIPFSPLGSFTADILGVHPLLVIIFGSFGLGTLFPRILNIVLVLVFFALNFSLLIILVLCKRPTCGDLYTSCSTKRQQSAPPAFVSECKLGKVLVVTKRVRDS